MRIAIVNDLPLSVEALRRVVTSVPGYKVAWTAADGEQAIAKASADLPDLILMDLIMPKMDGAQATRLIMQQSPCAILVVTATVEGNAGKVFEAMGCGALDAVDTPQLGPKGSMQGAQHLLDKIETIARLIGHESADLCALPKGKFHEHAEQLLPMVILGASTGGPAALATILASLPSKLNACLVIVQHVDAQFAPGLAAWLSKQSRRKVDVIPEHHIPQNNESLLAATNDHLRMDSKQQLYYSQEPGHLVYKPSVDVFLQDAVRHWRGPLLGVLLTGMGADGAEGLLALRKAGWPTVAQDKNSCIVYGMPKAAVQLQAAEWILPLDRIADAIMQGLNAFR